jgi:hypothetical protein
MPVMVTPRWSHAGPADHRDVLAYLIAALDAPPEVRCLEIGGATHVVSRRHGALAPARASELMIPVPFLTPTLSASGFD